MGFAQGDEYVPVSKEASEAAVPIAQEDDGVERFEVCTETWTRGQVQEDGYKDVYFAIAFWIQLAIMIVTAFLFAVGAIETNSDDTSWKRRLDVYTNINYSNHNGDEHSDATNNNSSETSDEDVEKMLSVVGLTLVISPIFAILALGLMKEHALGLIKASLWFGIGFSLLLCVALMAVAPVAGVFYGIMSLVLMCYAKAVWHRIPYAASNLRTAVTAIKANLGIALLSFGAVPVKLGWFFLWGYSLYETMQTDFMKNQVEEVEVDDDFNQGGETETLSAAGSVVVILFTLSLYWTAEVIKNTIHTTIAGVIGTWWFLPQEASSFCSKGLTDSFFRSTTYSFGSICFGSLIVAVLEVLKNSLRNARNNRNGGILRCIAYCLLVWIERLAEYFNKWAFIYVGLYGYSYLEAGKNVITLFRERGWTTIISDNLVYRMLGMMCLAIGLLMGLVGVLLALMMGVTDEGLLGGTAFLSFFVGVIMSGLMMGAVASSVDSILVLFCEAPAEFEENHPAMFREMRANWTDAWADVFTTHAVAVPQTNVV